MLRIGKHQKCSIQISNCVILPLTCKLVSIVDGHPLVATRCLHWARLQLEFVCVCLNVQIDCYVIKYVVYDDAVNVKSTGLQKLWVIPMRVLGFSSHVAQDSVLLGIRHFEAV